VLSFILNRSHGVVEELQGILYVQVLFYLMEKTSIKCTCKQGSNAVFLGKTGKTMNSDQTTRRLVPSFFFFIQNGVVLTELGI